MPIATTTEITVAHAARLLLVTAQTVRNHIRDGRINARCEGDSWFVSLASVQAFCAAREAEWRNKGEEALRVGTVEVPGGVDHAAGSGDSDHVRGTEGEQGPVGGRGSQVSDRAADRVGGPIPKRSRGKK